MRKRINKVETNSIDAREILKPEPQEVMDIVKDNSLEQIIVGWNNVTEVANEVWRDGNYKLLEGDLVLAYKNTGSANSGLYQIVVVKYFVGNDMLGKVYDGTYGISVTTSTCSYILPKVDIRFLEELKDDLSKYRIEQDVLNLLRKKLNDEITSN